MPAYNFQKQFAPAVEAGTKHLTIRAKRKHRPRIGQVAYCFTGMRTKKCRRLDARIILQVIDIKIDTCGVLFNGSALAADALDAFAQRDGFETWDQMLLWFYKTHGLPFYGDLIIW